MDTWTRGPVEPRWRGHVDMLSREGKPSGSAGPQLHINREDRFCGHVYLLPHEGEVCEHTGPVVHMFCPHGLDRHWRAGNYPNVTKVA